MYLSLLLLIIRLPELSDDSSLFMTNEFDAIIFKDYKLQVLFYKVPITHA